MHHHNSTERAILQPETVKRAVHPQQFYEFELPTMKRKAGGDRWQDGGLCPFHADNRPGSFKVHTGTGAYRCFSCGAHGGDVIAFTMNRYGMSFREALEHLATAWGAF